MIDNSKTKNYYDNYVDRQRRIGVNARHKSIFNKCVADGLKPEHDVLEIGCGIGTFTSLISPYIQTGKIIAMDISPKSIEVAKEEFSDENVVFIAGDVTDFDFSSQKFDAIILPDVLEHIPIKLHSKLFEKLNAILKPTGFIFIHIPNPYYLQWCHENRPDLLQVIDQPITTDVLVANSYKNGLIIEKLQSYSIWISDNDYQFIVLRKNGYQDFSNNITYKTSFWSKVKAKLNVIFQKK